MRDMIKTHWFLRTPPGMEKIHDRRFLLGRSGKQALLYRLYGSVAQMGEHLFCKQRVAGSNPAGSIFAGLAQLGERLPYKQDVGGSSPSASIFCPVRLTAGHMVLSHVMWGSNPPPGICGPFV